MVANGADRVVAFALLQIKKGVVHSTPFRFWISVIGIRLISQAKESKDNDNVVEVLVESSGFGKHCG